VAAPSEEQIAGAQDGPINGPPTLFGDKTGRARAGGGPVPAPLLHRGMLRSVLDMQPLFFACDDKKESPCSTGVFYLVCGILLHSDE
jgi:hypothetical protein